MKICKKILSTKVMSAYFAHSRQGDVIIIGSSFTWKKLTLVIIHFYIVSALEQSAGTFVLYKERRKPILTIIATNKEILIDKR